MELGNTILSEVTQSPNDILGMYSFIKWILAIKEDNHAILHRVKKAKQEVGHKQRTLNHT